MTTQSSNDKKYTSMCYKTGEQGAGQLVYEELSRRIKVTNRERVGFEIEGRIPPWESIRKNRLLLRYDVRGILNFANYGRRKQKRAEGVVKFRHKYTVAQQLIFIRVLIKLLAAKLVENRAQIILPRIGKLYINKTNQRGTYYDVKDGKYKTHLNLHTLRKFITIAFRKHGSLDAPTVVYKKSSFIKSSIYTFYKYKAQVYEKTLQKIREKHGLH
ncbi:MAG: hypothetical protein WAZ19_02530 [Anaerolineae bacterium]